MNKDREAGSLHVVGLFQSEGSGFYFLCALPINSNKTLKALFTEEPDTSENWCKVFRRHNVKDEILDIAILDHTHESHPVRLPRGLIATIINSDNWDGINAISPDFNEDVTSDNLTFKFPAFDLGTEIRQAQYRLNYIKDFDERQNTVSGTSTATWAKKYKMPRLPMNCFDPDGRWDSTKSLLLRVKYGFYTSHKKIETYMGIPVRAHAGGESELWTPEDLEWNGRFKSRNKDIDLDSSIHRTSDGTIGVTLWLFRYRKFPINVLDWVSGIDCDPEREYFDSGPRSIDAQNCLRKIYGIEDTEVLDPSSDYNWLQHLDEMTPLEQFAVRQFIS